MPTGTDQPAADDTATTRRGVLKAAAGGGLTLGVAKAIDNVVLGYGVISGTNLTEQNLAEIAGTGFRVFPSVYSVGTYDITATGSTITVTATSGEYHRTFDITDDPSDSAREVDESLGLNGVLTELTSDITAIHHNTHAFEFHPLDGFFDRLAATTARPFTTHAVRGWPGTKPRFVREFTGVDPRDPKRVISGLTDGFRDHSTYDIPRYAAGSIQDNVILGATDLRATFRSPTDFETLLEHGDVGLFCYDFAHRSIEALHATAAPNQRLPVVAARVWDQRHKHVYTAVGSVIRDNDALRIPMTFVDYTHTTLYDDLHLRALLGEGLRAYDSRHRATAIHWRP